MRTVGEEIDLVLSDSESFLLGECRWYAERIEPKHIRDFLGKLSKRPGVFGVFVSMSGFTDAAQIEIENAIAATPTVLLGPDDVASLFRQSQAFVTLFAERRRALVVRRRAEWA